MQYSELCYLYLRILEFYEFFNDIISFYFLNKFKKMFIPKIEDKNNSNTNYYLPELSRQIAKIVLAISNFETSLII